VSRRGDVATDIVAHRLALTTIAATFVLILFGGLVTNTGSALAVPDWPTTFGHNMFLYPWSEMVGGIFYEHSHRLLGSLVGLLTLALATVLWRAGGTLRWLGLVAVAAVVVQGILGGLRVVLLKETLAIVHGCLAQAYFALAVVIAVLTSRRHQTPVQGIDRTSRRLAIGAALLVYVQIVLGALITHAGWIWVHVLGAVAVFALVPIVTARLRRSGDVLAAPAARVLLVLLGIQVVLGVGSFISRFTPVWIPGGQVTMLALPVAHRLAASLILGAAVVAAVRAAGFGVPQRTRAGRALTNVRTAAGRPPLRLVRG
jgi:cytochrome c oxidase assembly protein subunit 15